QILRPEIVRTVATVPSSQRSQVMVMFQRSFTLTPRDSANSRSGRLLRAELQLEHDGTSALTQFRPSPLDRAAKCSTVSAGFGQSTHRPLFSALTAPRAGPSTQPQSAGYSRARRRWKLAVPTALPRSVRR